jgi:hypothetical protein
MTSKRVITGTISSLSGLGTVGSGAKHNPKVLPNPYVIIDFLFERGLLLIYIKNTSAVPAFNIHATFSRKLMGAEGTMNISALPLFTDLSFLPGGKEIATILDTSASFFRSNQPTRFSTHLTYQDFSGVRFSHTIVHNLEIYRRIGYVAQPA